MKVHYATKTGEKDVEVTNFYQDIAKLISEEPSDVGNVVITYKGGKVEYIVQPRSGTMFITELSNSLPDEILDNQFPSRYLTCVDEKKNAYKFYKLEQIGKEVKASYGRMGVEKGMLHGERSYLYPLSMFWIKYYEKIGKGYKDHSDVYLTPDASEKTPRNPVPSTTDIERGASYRLFETLRKFAKNAVKKAKVKVPITQAILDKSEECLEKMRNVKDVQDFNDYLLELIAILQRPVRTGDGTGVRRLMATNTADFADIIERETDLLMAMSGTIQKTSMSKSMVHGDFSDYDVEVYEATEKQKKQVLSHLSDTLKLKVKNVYRVIPKAQQERFNRYVKEHKILEIKQLWHGSRNQNWMSIIRNGLLLNPNAIITGKMFSKGIYFAPSSMKSWNYTSYHGTRWANGNDCCAFMGLYAVAYGKPWDVHVWQSSIDYRKETLSRGADCLHAHAGASLRNDEIVFYDEAAIVLNYIVEFE